VHRSTLCKPTASQIHAQVMVWKATNTDANYTEGAPTALSLWWVSKAAVTAVCRQGTSSFASPTGAAHQFLSRIKSVIWERTILISPSLCYVFCWASCTSLTTPDQRKLKAGKIGKERERRKKHCHLPAGYLCKWPTQPQLRGLCCIGAEWCSESWPLDFMVSSGYQELH